MSEIEFGYLIVTSLLLSFEHIDISSESYLELSNYIILIANNICKLIYSNLIFMKKELILPEDSKILKIIRYFDPQIDLLKNILSKVNINETNFTTNNLDYMNNIIGIQIDNSNRIIFFENYIKLLIRYTIFLVVKGLITKEDSIYNNLDKKEIKKCLLCSKRSKKACSVCKNLYCSIECQITDWETHKYICVEL